MFNHFNFLTCMPHNDTLQVDMIEGLSFDGVLGSSLIDGQIGLVHRMTSFNRRPAGKANSLASTTPEASTLAPRLQLTPRELEVLLWAARGKTAWETGELLGLTEKTVKFYIRNACARLTVQNKTHAVAVCISSGLFTI